MGRCGRLSEHVVEPTEPFAEPFGIKSNTVLLIPQPGSLQSNRKRDPVNELEDVRTDRGEHAQTFLKPDFSRDT